MGQSLIVGLGNPGREYEKTRHNIGFLVVEEIAERHGIRLKEQKKLLAKVGKGRVGENEVTLALPQTYMNESGQAVRRVCDYYKLSANDLLVIADDADLPFGKQRVRAHGGAGGHNGLLSIATHMGTQKYARLRLGIGRDERRGDLADFVLGDFTKAEADELDQVIRRAVEIVELAVSMSVTDVMNTANG